MEVRRDAHHPRESLILAPLGWGPGVAGGCWGHRGEDEAEILAVDPGLCVFLLKAGQDRGPDSCGRAGVGHGTGAGQDPGPWDWTVPGASWLSAADQGRLDLGGR